MSIKIPKGAIQENPVTFPSSLKARMLEGGGGPGNGGAPWVPVKLHFLLYRKEGDSYDMGETGGHYT